MANYTKIVDEVKEMHRTLMASHPNYADKDLFEPKMCHEKSYIDQLYYWFYINIHWYESRYTPENFKKFLVDFYVTPYMADIMRITEAHKQLQQVKNTLLNKQDTKPKWFITIGFNHQTFKISDAVLVIRRICENKIFKEIRGVFEMFRENGEHPHVHFLAELHETLPKSKILEKLWATKGIKKQVFSKTFIDVKKAEDYHTNYILGIKKQEKMKYIEKDKEFRKKNNIPEFFSQPIL